MTEELEVINPGQVGEYALTVADVKGQVARILEIMSGVMKEDVHYGTIPGTQKPTLLKPGAEVLRLAFGLEPEFKVIEHELDGPVSGHMRYTVHCTLRHPPTDTVVGAGLGVCSTMESKYRYRWDFTPLDGERIPEDYRANKKAYREQGLGCRQIGGKWFWGEQTRVENEDIADVVNTAAKIAKKRAFVDATLTGTCASHVFTQDMEDMSDVIDVEVDKDGEAKPKSDPPGSETPPPPTIESMDNILPAEGRDLIIKTFKTAKITKEQLEQEVELEADEWTEGNAAHFRTLWTRIENGVLAPDKIGTGLAADD